jgi:hypothetical protein
LRTAVPACLLPWVEKDSIKPDTTKQQVTFGFQKKEDFNYDEVKKTIEGRTEFKVGKVLKEK